jgi:hypothetical protein
MYLDKYLKFWNLTSKEVDGPSVDGKKKKKTYLDNRLEDKVAVYIIHLFHF